MNENSNNNRTNWLCVGLLVSATAVAYFPSFWGAFVFDDVPHIVDNKAFQSPAKLGPYLLENGRPVAIASLAANYGLGGANPVGYHAFNLFIHLSAGLALFGIVTRTIKMPKLSDRYAPSAHWLAFAIALLWLIHPLQTQSVTYIVQRCESMMGLFFLLMLYCVIRGSQASRGWPWYLAGAVAFWLGMGCKEVIVTALVVVPLYDRVFLASSWREVIQRRWAFYLALIPPVVWLVFYIMRVPAEANAGFAFKAITPWEYLCSQPMVLMHYLRLSLLPDRLCLDYGWQVAANWWQIVPAGLLMLALFVTSLIAVFRYRSPLGFVGLCFFLVLAPTSSFMPIADLAFEHRMYLPLACVLTLLVFGGYHLGLHLVKSAQTRKAVFGTAVALLAVVMITRTFVRNRLYSVPLALWANVLANNPDNVRAHINYGHHMAKNGHWDEAIKHHRIAIELAPDDLSAHDNLAKLLAYQGQRDEALEHFILVRDRCPKWGSPHYHIGILLLAKGEVDEALVSLHKADEIKPDYSGCLYRLGTAYQAKGDYPKALGYLRRALDAEPEGKVEYKILLALGETLSLHGDLKAAEDQFEKSLNRFGKFAKTYTVYGEHFARHNEFKLAEVCYQRALECLPDFKPAKTALADLQKQLNESADPPLDEAHPVTADPTEVEAAALPATNAPEAS